jgi:glycosyltransferase involved in cell wall biosynthesis
MANSLTSETTDLTLKSQPSIDTPDVRLQGKRVAMVMFSHYPADPRPRRAVDSLVREGMRVDLVCLADGNAPRREFLNGIEVLRIPLKRRRGGKLAYVYQYSAFILISLLVFGWRALTRGYDLVYVHNMPDVLVLSGLVPKMLGAKVVLDQHDPMPELMTTIFGLDEKSASVRLIRLLEKWSIAFADALITVNIACKRIFSSRSCRPEKIEVVMNSPDENIFRFRSAETNPAGSRGNKPFVIMYHGSLVERNGLDLAVEALALVQETMPNAELRVYGPNSPFLERVLEMAKSKGVDRAVRYLGPKRLEELVHEIEACDVGVVPNQKNSFTAINTPTRIFEYLSLGKPVIAPRTPGIQDYFGKDSLLFFEAGDAQDLANALRYAFLRPAELGEFAKRGQEVYREHDWRRERLRLTGLVAKLLDKEPARVQSKPEAGRSQQRLAQPTSELK